MLLGSPTWGDRYQAEGWYVTPLSSTCRGSEEDNRAQGVRAYHPGYQGHSRSHRGFLAFNIGSCNKLTCNLHWSAGTKTKAGWEGGEEGLRGEDGEELGAGTDGGDRVEGGGLVQFGGIPAVGDAFMLKSVNKNLH